MNYEGLAEGETIKAKKLSDFLDSKPKESLLDYFYRQILPGVPDSEDMPALLNNLELDDRYAMFKEICLLALVGRQEEATVLLQVGLGKAEMIRSMKDNKN